jgi:hypothetical protein
MGWTIQKAKGQAEKRFFLIKKICISNAEILHPGCEIFQKPCSDNSENAITIQKTA